MPIDLSKFQDGQVELPLTFKQLQDEHKVWSKYNFDSVYPDSEKFWQPVFGITEELGELCHALLKKSQNIRGTTEQHDAKARDAIADITVFLASTCSALGFDWQEIIETEWPKVRARDYKKDAALKTDTTANEGTKVIINGNAYIVYKKTLNYDEIVQLAFPTAKIGVLWTIVAKWKGSEAYTEGRCHIAPGQEILVRPNTIINLAHTGNA